MQILCCDILVLMRGTSLHATVETVKRFFRDALLRKSQNPNKVARAHAKRQGVVRQNAAAVLEQLHLLKLGRGSGAFRSCYVQGINIGLNYSLGFRVQGSGFRVQGSGFRV